MAFLKKKKKKENDVCEHDFEDKFAVVLLDKYPRVISVCKDCGLAVHRQVYSIKKVREMERDEESY